MTIFLHELVDVVPGCGERYADSMAEHHGTSPARAGRRDTMLGLFLAVAVHGRGPRNVNLWRTGTTDDVADQLARQFEPGVQDARLRDWWLANLDLRTGGTDRLVRRVDFSPDVPDLRARGVTGKLFLHEIVRTPPGGLDRYLDALGSEGVPAAGESGALLVGAYRSLGSDHEAIVLWGYAAAVDFSRHLAAWAARGGRAGRWRRRERELLVEKESLVLRARHFVTSPWHS